MPFFESLVGRNLLTLYAVVIVDAGERVRLDNTLVFQVDHEHAYFQLLVAQADLLLRSMQDEHDVLLWGEFFDEETAVLEPLDPGIAEGADIGVRGFEIAAIEEYWTNDGEIDFLMGAVFVESEGARRLAILTGGTEAEVVSPEMLLTIITEMGFPYRVVYLTQAQS